MLIHKATHEFASFCNVIVDDVKSPFSRVCQLKMKKDPLSSFSIKTKKILHDLSLCYNYKPNRFLIAEGMFSNRSQKMSKFGKNISDTLQYVLHNDLFAPFMFLP